MTTGHRQLAAPREDPGHQDRVDQVFFELDDRTFAVDGQVWHLEVYGICEQDDQLWVQLAIDGPQQYMLTVTMATESSVQRVIEALSTWLVHPSNVHPVLRVA